MCPVCSKELSSQQVLDKHISIVHSATRARLNCKLCGQGFKRDHDLRMHYWSIHLKAKPYKCRHCSFSGTQYNRIYEHCRTVHKVSGDKSQIEIVAKEMERIKEFEIQNGLNRKEVIRIKDKSKKHCFLCNEYHEKKEYLVKHELEHLKLRPFVCEVEGCGIDFNVEKNLKRHLLGVHGKSSQNLKPLELVMMYERVRTIPLCLLQVYDQFYRDSGCVKCQYLKLPTLAHFYDHFHTVHSGDFGEVHKEPYEKSSPEEQLVCKCCGMETQSLKVLTRHIKEVHRMDAIGYDNFSPPQVVENHQPKILSLPQFKCKHCLNYTSVKKSTMLNHVKKIHNVSSISENDLLFIS